jgi:hypothetical protein
MIPPPDHDLAWGCLLLEVTLQAKIGAALRQHFVIHRSMRVVTCGATFPHRLMLEHERSALRDMALGAGFLVRGQRERTTGRRLSLVRIMAIAATHLPISDRMMIRQIEPPFHLQMAGEADLWIAIGIDDRVPRPAGLRMQAPRAVATLAADILRIRSMRHQSGVRCRREMLVHFGVTFGTGTRADEFCSGNIGRQHHHSIDSNAGYQPAG